MTKQYEFEDAINNNNIEKVKSLLKDKKINPSCKNNLALQLVSQTGNLDILKLILNDKRTNPSDKNNYFIQLAAESGHFQLVDFLLKDSRVNPSEDNNYAIISVYESIKTYKKEISENKLISEEKILYVEGENNVSLFLSFSLTLDLLWKDERIKKTLANDNIQTYNDLISLDIQNKVREF
jgi:hypothetical protein